MDRPAGETNSPVPKTATTNVPAVRAKAPTVSKSKYEALEARYRGALQKSRDLIADDGDAMAMVASGFVLGLADKEDMLDKLSFGGIDGKVVVGGVGYLLTRKMRKGIGKYGRDASIAALTIAAHGAGERGSLKVGEDDDPTGTDDT